MPAVRKTLVHDQGTTFNMGVEFVDSNDVPVDLTGHAVTFDVYGNSNYRYHATVGMGYFNIKVTDEETTKWGSGRLSYVVDHHSPNGDVDRMFYGPLDIKGVK